MFKAAIKTSLICITILLCTVLAWFFLRLRKPLWRDRAIRFLSRSVLWIGGVKVTRSGKPVERGPLLVVSNHLSYMDVPVLASQDNIRFTPKSEIRHWPFIGWMSQVQGSVFVERRPEKVKEVGDSIKRALQAGETICLFPEASTGNGLHLLPFKSSFFSLAEEQYNGRELLVQPVAIAYRTILNLPIGMTQWPEVAWYGDMDLVPHLWNFMKIAPVAVHVHYLPPVTAAQFGGRKQLAAYCQQVIEEAIKG